MKSTIYRYAIVFVIVFLLMGVALILSLIINAYTSIKEETLTPILYALATLLFVSAGIGRLGWEIQTWNGNTPEEKLNKWIFLVSTGLAGFLLFVAYFL